MQARDRLCKQQKSLNVLWFSVSLCLWAALSTSPYLNQYKGIYIEKIYSGEGRIVIIVGREGQPIISKTLCLDCVVHGFMTKPSFTVAALVLTEHKAGYKVLKADVEKLRSIQHYFQTSPLKLCKFQH